MPYRTNESPPTGTERILRDANLTVRGYCPPTTPPPRRTDRYRSRYIVTRQLRSRTRHAHVSRTNRSRTRARGYCAVHTMGTVPAIVIFPPPFLHSCRPRRSGQRSEGPGATCPGCWAITILGFRNGDDLCVKFRVTFSSFYVHTVAKRLTSATRLRRTAYTRQTRDALENLVTRRES